MMLFWILLGVAVFLVAAVLIISYICYRMAFYAPRKSGGADDDLNIPQDEAYKPFRDSIEKWAKETKALPHEEFSITSFDGLRLYGKYYECESGAPIELMFHGYRGSAERDLSGGVQRCFKLGHNAFIVNQRCSGKSDGRVISFGINEHRDCIYWVDFMINHFGPDVKIMLTGISMGAATVLMAAGKPLPENVIGVLADCGYNSPRDIIKKVIKQIGLPADISYFFVRLGARIYGHFDLEETSPEQALKNCKLPVLFIHGESDDFVPHEMSRINFDACSSRKKIVIIKNAGHGLSYPVAPEQYLDEMREFFGEV